MAEPLETVSIKALQTLEEEFRECRPLTRQYAISSLLFRNLFDICTGDF
jgi:hypothetical protein